MSINVTLKVVHLLALLPTASVARTSTVEQSLLVCLHSNGNGTLSAVAFDGVNVVKQKTSVDGLPTFEFCVNAKKLVSVINTLNADADLTIVIDDKKVELNASNCRFSLLRTPVSHFKDALPTNADKNVLAKFTVESKFFARSLDETAYATNPNSTKSHERGVWLIAKEKTLKLYATDGHRLSRQVVACKAVDNESQKVISPLTCDLIEGFAADYPDADINVTVGEQSMIFSIGNVKLTTLLIAAGKPVPFDSVIPTADRFKSTISFKRDEFLSALNTVAAMADEKTRGLSLNLNEAGLVLNAHNKAEGDAEVHVSSKLSGDSVNIGVNLHYLKDAVKAIHDDEVCLSAIDSDSPMVLMGVGNKSSLALIMPMRL